MGTRAKFILEEKAEFTGGYRLRFRAVHSGSPENERFFHYTPNGSLEMQVVKQEVADQFKVGQEYYLDLSPAIAE